MKTVIEMAREAGAIHIFERPKEFAVVGNEVIERFAELVRADEREKYKWDIHSCGPDCKRYACVSMREAVEAERDACAKVCDDRAFQFFSESPFFVEMHGLADAIRARSNT
jgi:hypothetical protein